MKINAGIKIESENMEKLLQEHVEKRKEVMRKKEKLKWLIVLGLCVSFYFVS